MRISDWSSDVCSSDLSIFDQPADLVILDHHIGTGQQVAQFGLALPGRDIDRNAALAAVAAMIIGRAQRLAPLARDEGRAPLARVVPPARPLDLHHLGAEVGEQLPAPRPPPPAPP